MPASRRMSKARRTESSGEALGSRMKIRMCHLAYDKSWAEFSHKLQRRQANTPLAEQFPYLFSNVPLAKITAERLSRKLGLTGTAVSEGSDLAIRPFAFQGIRCHLRTQ